MNAYPLGQTIDLGPWELRNAAGTLTAATSSSCTVMLPDGTTTTPAVTSSATGIYSAAYTPASQIGLYHYETTLTLADGSKAVNVGEFYVSATAFDPNPADLTDLAAVRAFLQRPAADTNQDAVISSLITAASREISREFAREFAPPVATATRRFRVATREPFLSLAPYDLRALTTLALDPETSSPTVLTRYTDFDLLPIPNPDGVYTSIRFYTSLRNSNGTHRRLDITGAWGFPTVPDDVKHWCNVTVAEWLRKDVSAFSSVFNIDTQQVERPASLPTAVLAGLRDYRRGA